MSTTEFIRASLRQMHNTYDDAVGDLTLEQLHWRANDKGLPASFILWHYVRTEDNIIQFVLQRKQTVWLEEGWDKRLGLDRVSQGTGMNLDDAQALRSRPRMTSFNTLRPSGKRQTSSSRKPTTSFCRDELP
jgi:hypothetical protein